jgi:hypothetical protein
VGFDIEGTMECKFTDGLFVVPKWWARYACMRPVTYEDGKPVVMNTLAETRDLINKDMLNGVWQTALRQHRRGTR